MDATIQAANVVSRHQDHRQDAFVEHWVLIQVVALGEDLSTTRRDLRLRQTPVCFLLNALRSERYFLQPLLNHLHGLV